MSNAFHKNLINDDIHALPARTYADVAARDADVAFQVVANVDKKVRVDSPSSYYMLFSVGPVVWLEVTNTEKDALLELNDTPSTYVGQAGKVTQVNAGGTAIEFGQALRPTDSPTFNVLTVDGNCGLVVGSSPPFFDDNGFLTLENIDGLDPQTEFTFENALDSFPNLTLIQDQAISLLGSLTVEAASILNQDLTTDAAAAFASLSLGGAGLTMGASVPFSDIAGVLTLQNIDALDAATEATIEASIDTLANLTSVQGQAVLLLGSLAVEATSILNQDLTTDAFPQFAGLTLTGNLTVQGETFLEDKNIELGNVSVPTDITANGGGITLKASTDITILWLNATNSWTFNQSIDLIGNNLLTTGTVLAGRVLVDNLQLEGNTLSVGFGDLDITTQTGGVAKFTLNAFQVGQDSSNFLEIGHGSSNAFINGVGAGGIDFRFGGTTKATFTPFGHLHLLTDVDQKHTLKIVTANNLNDTGIAWENSGGAFTQTIFRTDVGSNRADLIFAAGQNTDIDVLTNSFKIHGSAATEGRLEILAALQISSGAPGAGKVLTSDAVGLATWTLPAVLAAGGFTDAGTNVVLTDITDRVGIGTVNPAAQLEVGGQPGASVGGFPSGQLHVTGQSALVNANAVITGHNLFGGNKQLWYLGSSSGSNDDVLFINRQTGNMSFLTGGTTRIRIEDGGDVGIGTSNPTEKLEVAGNVKATTIIDTTIFAQLTSSVDQVPTDTNPVIIAYNTQDFIAGLTHSTTVNPGEITIDTAGVYFVSPQPQVGKDSGGLKVDFDLFWQIDRGSGFADEPNSNIKLTIKDADITDVRVAAFAVFLNVGDKIRMMQKVSNAGVGMGLKNTDPVVVPPTVPRTPSIILTVYRIGG